MNVGDNATFKCSPSDLSSLPILSTTDPVTGQTKALIHDDRVISEHVQAQPPFRRFIWLNASQEDDRRKFFCTFANVISDTSTLLIACKCHFNLVTGDVCHRLAVQI